MLNKEECIRKIAECRSILSENFGVKAILLFGSVARGEQTETSDIDICVDMEPNLLRHVGLKQYLEELLHCGVDVIRKHRNMDVLLKNEIERDGIYIFR